MVRLEDLKPNATVRGILPTGLVTVVNIQWHGSVAVELTYKDAAGKVVGDAKLQADGKADKLEGKVQNAVGGIKDALKKKK